MNILILLAIVGIIVGSFLLVSISNNVYVYGQPDLYLEGNVRLNENDPILSDLYITKFEFQGQALKDICPYGIYLCPCKSCDIQLFL
jgi:hypothetical protein